MQEKAGGEYRARAAREETRLKRITREYQEKRQEVERDREVKWAHPVIRVLGADREIADLGSGARLDDAGERARLEREIFAAAVAVGGGELAPGAQHLRHGGRSFAA